MPVNVFLSYSREDRSQAEAVIRALEARGCAVWWDGLLVGGLAFAKSTEQALENASAVLVLWSKISVESHWVRDEATRGRDRGCLVPATLDGTMPPLGFRQYQVIDLTRWRGKNDAPEMDAIHYAIRAVSGSASGAPPSPAPAPRAAWSRRSWLLGAGGVGAATLAGAGLFWWRRTTPAPALASPVQVPKRALVIEQREILHRVARLAGTRRGFRAQAEAQRHGEERRKQAEKAG